MRAEQGKALGSSRFFHFQFNLFHVSMLLVPMVDNLVFLWVLITSTTVISAPLIDYRRDRRAQEAAWKYIMISSSGIVFCFARHYLSDQCFPAQRSASETLYRYQLV